MQSLNKYFGKHLRKDGHPFGWSFVYMSRLPLYAPKGIAASNLVHYVLRWYTCLYRNGTNVCAKMCHPLHLTLRNLSITMQQSPILL